MGMFSDLMGKIFHHHTADAAAPPEGIPRGPLATAPRPAGGPTAATATSSTGAPTATAEPVDVEAILNKLAAGSSEKLNWKQSIVDLMKLVGMDSSFANRKALAAELHYTGDTGDSAAMNIWLHKEVMKKLAENGGKVPANLLD